MQSETHNILIIGAGPAGLATAGRLRKAEIDFKIIEKTQNVGNRWRHHYDRLHLHSVKRLSHLPFLPFPEEYPLYVPRTNVVEYLESYAKHFKIEPEFGVSVEKVSKTEEGLWKVTTQNGDILARSVVVASGTNNAPKSPSWEGMNEFEGTITHSVDYKNPDKFLNSRTLVVGMGNTGAEIALDLSNYGISTYLSVRGAVNIVPRDLNGQPVQETGILLDKLPFGLGTWIGAKVQGIYFGNLTKYGIEKSKLPPAVELKTTGKTPIVDIGTIEAVKKGKIKMVGEVANLIPTGVAMKDGSNINIEHIILATGYDSCLTKLVEKMPEFFDQLGNPIGAIGTGHHKNMYFVGFNNYRLGGILGTIYTDSEEVVNDLQ